MLVLSRERYEAIVMSFLDATDEELLSLRGETIEVTTVDIRGPKVRTGIEAPSFIAIDRKEVHEAKQATRQAVRRDRP